MHQRTRFFLGRSALISIVFWTCGPVAFAQPTLQITSPANNTIVNPGQTVKFTVSPSGGSFESVAIAGELTGITKLLTSPPYQFSVQIPVGSDLRPYEFSAIGFPSNGNLVGSLPIILDVERPDPPVSIRTEHPKLSFYELGDDEPILATATYEDGSTADVTRSSNTTYSVIALSSPPAVSVTPEGRVTALAYGSARVVINGKYSVVATVFPPIAIAPVNWGIYPSQTHRFDATVNPMLVGDLAVVWSASLGTIDSTGRYTAPATVSSKQFSTITATSVANPALSGSTSLTIYPASDVMIRPTTVSLGPSQTQQFVGSATRLSDSVHWSIAPAGAGSIDELGLYSSPSSITSPQTVTVTATSAAMPTSKATATVNLIASPATDRPRQQD